MSVGDDGRIWSMALLAGLAGAVALRGAHGARAVSGSGNLMDYYDHAAASDGRQPWKKRDPGFAKAVSKAARAFRWLSDSEQRVFFGVVSGPSDPTRPEDDRDAWYGIVMIGNPDGQDVRPVSQVLGPYWDPEADGTEGEALSEQTGVQVSSSSEADALLEAYRRARKTMGHPYEDARDHEALEALDEMSDERWRRRGR